MSKLQELIKKANQVNVYCNGHRSSYRTVEEELQNPSLFEEDFEDMPEEVKQKMIESDIMICLQVYPRSPVGFFTIWHWDIEQAAEIALNPENF